MNYEKIYADFIASRQNLPGPEGYGESHHIIPKALGGADTANNLIRLTARDHYFAHCCLAKIHGGKMWAALHAMVYAQIEQRREGLYLKARMFAGARAKYAAHQSEIMRGVWASGFTRNRVYEAPSAEARKVMSDKAKLRRVTETTKAKMLATQQASAPRFVFFHLDRREVFEGTGLEFRAHSGVGQSQVSKLTKGQISLAHGWVLEHNKDYARGKEDRTIRVFAHRDGRVFRGTMLSFYKTFVLDPSSVHRMVKTNGKAPLKSHKGWKYEGEE